jgi:hypothetical protein
LKKILRQVLRIISTVSAPAQITVNWWPVNPAELGQRLACTRLGSIARREDNAPRCLAETRVATA